MPHDEKNQPVTLTNISALTIELHNLLAKAPEWLRRDFSAHDALGRERAEEALAAMILELLKNYESRTNSNS